ncbi:PHP domain-containing protein [Fibrobacterota bacterium]
MSYVPLHIHSDFSFHAGVCSVPELVARAKDLGFTALALTDTDRMSGLILFYLECRKQGIKPILGTELTEPGRPHENVVLLAKNASGYSDLCEIITRRHLRPEEFSFAKIFAKPWPDLFLLTHSPGYLRVLHAGPNRGNLYAELINHSGATRAASRRLEKEARELGIPPAVSNNSFFLDREDWHIHRVMRAIGLNSSLSRLKPEEYAHRNAFFRPSGQMAKLFPGHGQALENTGIIAGQCDADLKLGEWIMPEIEVPEEHSPESYLRRLAREGLERNYRGRDTYARAREIQERELGVISQLGYASYFLMVKQIRDWSGRFKKGISYRSASDCSLMRGSAANSITFYNIGASDLDPIKYNLYFERFLNEERAAPPDADLDFGWDERDAAFDFFTRTWGQDRVAVICTFNHYHRRSAFRETAKVFGWTEEQITAFMEKNSSPEEASGSRDVRRIRHYADRLRGKPRFLGQHPGGIVVTNAPVRRHVACERSGGAKDRVITQIDMHSGTDELGLIKFDILGNGSISVLRDTLAQLEKQGLPNPKLHEEERVQTDPGVLDMIARGRTRGIFYIESPAQMRLNMKTNARSFAEIGITTSLIRPAGARYAKLFVERHRQWQQGAADWDYLHDSLESILHETHDCLVFQEDVIKVCHLIAGMPLKRADRVRKMMNSLQEGVPGDYARVEEEFVRGCMAKSGFSPEQAAELWSRICSFVGFSFCKSHSLSFAQLSFKCAYLKRYFPAQFMAAVISNSHGFYHRSVYLNEARRFGVSIKPLHVNHSEIRYIGKENTIIPGLMHIRGFSRAAREQLVEERRLRGPYRDMDDFLERTRAGKSEIRGLIQVGALDGFGLNQPQLMFRLDQRYGRRRSREQSLFGPADTEGGGLEVEDYTLTVKCLNELHLLGFMLSGDVLSILDLHPAFKSAVPCREIGRRARQRVKLFGWPITGRLHTVPGRGQMKFLTLEDASGCADIVFWPETYKRYLHVMLRPGPYEVWGRVQEEWGTYSVIADRIKSVRWSPNQVDFELASRKLARSQGITGRRRGWRIPYVA